MIRCLMRATLCFSDCCPQSVRHRTRRAQVELFCDPVQGHRGFVLQTPGQPVLHGLPIPPKHEILRLSNLPVGWPWPAALRRRPPPFYVAPLGRDAARSCHAFPPASPSGTLYLPSIFETQLSGHAQTFPLNPSTPSTNMCLCGTRFRGVARQRRGIIRRTRRQTTPRQPEPHGTLRGGHGDFGGVTPAGRGGRGQGT